MRTFYLLEAGTNLTAEKIDAFTNSMVSTSEKQIDYISGLYHIAGILFTLILCSFIFLVVTAFVIKKLKEAYPAFFEELEKLRRTSKPVKEPAFLEELEPSDHWEELDDLHGLHGLEEQPTTYEKALLEEGVYPKVFVLSRRRRPKTCLVGQEIVAILEKVSRSDKYYMELGELLPLYDDLEVNCKENKELRYSYETETLHVLTMLQEVRKSLNLGLPQQDEVIQKALEQLVVVLKETHFRIYNVIREPLLMETVLLKELQELQAQRSEGVDKQSHQ